MAHDVFVSYSHADKPLALAACAALEQARIPCWIAPRDIEPGSTWSEAITEAIPASKAMLLVFSAHANKSRQILREVELAFDSDLIVVPLRVENVMPEKGLKYYLS